MAYHIAGNFRKGKFSKNSKITMCFRKYFFENSTSGFEVTIKESIAGYI